MRLDRAIIVAKKDLSEFAKNRYIMMTIVMMPLIASVILPIVYVVPINQLSRQTNTELGYLRFNITMEFNNVTLTEATLINTKLDHVILSNCIVQDCIIDNSTVLKSNLNQTRIAYSTVTDSMLDRCILINLTSNIDNTVRKSQYAGGNDELDKLQAIMFNVLLILLIMTPVTIPTVTASYSFVGEKVNRSLEPLLATPTTDLELLAGKSGSIFAVSMGATWLSFIVAVVLVDVLTEPFLGYYPLPNAYWIVGILLLAPGMCLMSILVNVIISSRVNDVRVSQQIGGVLILPVLLFFFFSLAGVLSTALLPMLVFSLIILLADCLIVLLSLRIFNREEILVNWK
jgi:ABC-2 type transport system permease protein